MGSFLGHFRASGPGPEAWDLGWKCDGMFFFRSLPAGGDGMFFFTQPRPAGGDGMFFFTQARPGPSDGMFFLRRPKSKNLAGMIFGGPRNKKHAVTK